MTRFPSALLTLILVGTAAAQGQAPTGSVSWLESLSITASASASWVDNISRTSYAPTRKDAMTYEGSISATRNQQLAPSWLGHAGLNADYLAVPDYDLTSRVQLGINAGLQKKFGLGPLAPVLQFDAGLGYKAIRLAADRGWTAEAGVRFAKRLRPELSVAANARWLEHYAKSSSFDIQQRSLGLEASWDMTDRFRLSGTASWLQGGVVANAVGSVYWRALAGDFGPVIQKYYSAIPFEVTDAYGPGWTAYNVEARVQMWSLALAYKLTEQASLEFRTDRAYVINRVDVRYPTKSWGLGLNYRF